jgi:PAS domain-containing protein
MSRPFIDFVHPDDRQRTLRQNASVRGGGQARAFENRYLCKDGSYRWLVWHAAPDTGERTIYSVASDITAHKRTEAEEERVRHRLDATLVELKSHGPILSVCSYCGKFPHADDPAWSVDRYLALHARLRLSHGVCPTCLKVILEPQIARMA